jgi:hypothetical protein
MKMMFVTCAECGCLSRDLEFCDNCKAQLKNRTISGRCLIPKLPDKKALSEAATQELPALSTSASMTDTAEIDVAKLVAPSPSGAASHATPGPSPAPIPAPPTPPSAVAAPVATLSQGNGQSTTSTLAPAEAAHSLSWMTVLAFIVPLLVVGGLLWLAIWKGVL